MLSFGKNKFLTLHVITNNSKQTRTMSYFDSLLQKRGLKKCPLPLWKLKVTNEEYSELKKELRECTRWTCYGSNPFEHHEKESALFFAEYWRREYVKGTHTIEMVYKAFKPIQTRDNLINQFYEAACSGSGAKSLGIEKYEGYKDQSLEDLLYQGGLPMRLVTQSQNNNGWGRFTRGIINKRVDYDELPGLGVIAKQSKSINDFCDQLIQGIETEDPKHMPFYCEGDEKDLWFKFLIDLARNEHIRQRQSRPFTCNWEFEVDNVENRIKGIKYDIKGPQSLPQQFLNDKELSTVSAFSVQVRVNGKAVDTFDYINNYSRYSVESKHTYRQGDSISLFLHNQEQPYFTVEMDLSFPHILFCNDRGLYELGNKMGTHKGLILFSDGWTVENVDSSKLTSYTWGDTTLHGLRINDTSTDDITLKGEDGNIVFGISKASYWTDIKTPPLYMPYIVEPIYNAGDCKFSLCSEDNDHHIAQNVEYRSKWQSEWKEKPSIGEIYVRAKSSNFVAPIRLINVGDGLSINTVSANKDVCQIQVKWQHGHVHTAEGRKISGNDDTWEIKKEDLKDSKIIPFVFTPHGNANNQFTLSIKAPFRDFAIYDIQGRPIDNDFCIPYIDVDRYQYHIVGQDVKFTLGNITIYIYWNNGNPYICETDGNKKIKISIPYEGSLMTLFGNREKLRALLDRTTKSPFNTAVNVIFSKDNENLLKFSIKEFPYRVKIQGNGIIAIGYYTENKTWKSARFQGMLKLAELEKPYSKPIEIFYSENEGCTLPEEIHSWKSALIYGRTKGRVFPYIIPDINNPNNEDNRADIIEKTKSKIMGQLSCSQINPILWDFRIVGWFHRSQKENIPASSLLEFKCVAKSARNLLCLAFLLYANCKVKEGEPYTLEEKRDNLRQQLKSFSEDLSFQWYWVIPCMDNIQEILEDFILGSSSSFCNIYYLWASRQDNPDYKERSDLNAMICFTQIREEFVSWMKELCVSSMLVTYNGEAGEDERSMAELIVNKEYQMEEAMVVYVENNQNDIDEETTKFFEIVAHDKIGNAKGNELWLMQRVIKVTEHLRKDIDLFAQDGKIRRSIIYCHKSNLYRFLAELNNQLYINKK